MRRFIWLAITVLLIMFVTITPNVLAQSGGTYDLTWNTIDGGGVIDASGGTFTMSGTIGQADAGTMSGGTYTLTGGFWGFLDQTVSNSNINLYLPFIKK